MFYGVANWVVTYIGPVIKAIWKCVATIVIGIFIVVVMYIWIADYLFTKEYRKASESKPEQMYDYTGR
jgi:putative effector of murein hydrolase LrgA (UPF0299 family)